MKTDHVLNSSYSHSLCYYIFYLSYSNIGNSLKYKQNVNVHMYNPVFKKHYSFVIQIYDTLFIIEI